MTAYGTGFRDLDYDENPILKEDCKIKSPSGWVTCDLVLSSKGKIILYEVTNSFFGGGTYDTVHRYWIDQVNNVRIESHTFGGDVLVIFWTDHNGVAEAYKYYKMKNPTAFREAILETKSEQKKAANIDKDFIGILRSHEKISFDHIIKILREKWNDRIPNVPSEIVSKWKTGIPLSTTEKKFLDDKVANAIEKMITDNKIEGFVDNEKREFTHMATYKQKKVIVNYQIASMEIGKDGTVLVQCPYCKQPKPRKEVGPEIKCPACGKTYHVAKNTLDLI